ncbi:TetR/AcrR family transcriptional regulator [Methylomarinum sp. Ch1-1]|uniref:TetR/AcrR family transcriptional regulator n=1 Tax=Methylomarinum roseum TaxID=3067653 RepID=A0AAU7NWB3_9GAMM|nr:TetR/AcrR family transcriptional regulator [Methylomarinum sp. Ch1-1]MDP4522721.1 TetR/AcrR family transcriptional regulator [Methylomarinum sp. Ch1-1]
MRTTIKKDAIVETAYRLFKENGFYATGVDLIMREAAVSKRTLYKYYPTKNALILAVLEHYRASYQQHIDELLENAQEDARDKIRAIFNDAAGWFGDVNFHGCLAVNAMGEFADKDEAIENACRQFKQWEVGVLTELCTAMGADQAGQLAYKLFVLLEGMSAIAQVNKGVCPVDMIALAEQVIDAHLSAD